MDYIIPFKIEVSLINQILDILQNGKWRTLDSKNVSNSNKKVEIPNLKKNKLYFSTLIQTRQLKNTSILLKNSIFKNIIYRDDILNVVCRNLNLSKRDIQIRKIDVFHNESHSSFSESIKHGWHVDEPHLQLKGKKFIKLFIPLSTVSIDNGPTHIAIGSRENLVVPLEKLAESPGKRYPETVISNYYGDRIKLLTSSIGDMFLARTDGFHKGGFVKKGYRTIVIVEYSNNIK